MQKSESLIRFIKRPMRENKGKKLWIYLDDPPIHKSTVLKKWPADHRMTILNNLRRYSPDINPQEQL